MLTSGRWLVFLATLASALLWAPLRAAEPYHANYVFGSDSSVLDFANVVTAVPNNVLSEVIRRDRIFKAALNGVTYRSHLFEKGNDALSLVQGGKIEAGILGDLPALELLATDSAKVFGLARHSYIVVVGPRGRTLSDLKGQRIGYAPGTAAHFGLLQGLENLGLDEKSVSLVPLAIGDMAEALVSGRVAAISIHEPLPSTLLAKYPDRFAAMHKQVATAYLIIARPFTQSQPEATRQLIAALARAIRWMRKDRTHVTEAARWTIASMKPFTGQATPGESEIVRLTRDNLLDLQEAPALPKNSLESNGMLAREFALMQRLGKLPANALWENVKRNFDFSSVTEIINNPKKFQLNDFDYEK